jgi:hypothetical protein
MLGIIDACGLLLLLLLLLLLGLLITQLLHLC